MRIYDANIKIAGLNSARTLIYITVPTNKLVTVLNLSISNASNEANEQLEAVLQKITTVGTPTKTDITPTKHDQGDPVAGSTVAGNVTASEPTYTAGVELARQGFPSLSGYIYPLTQIPREALPALAGGDSWGLRMLSTPAAFDAVVVLTFGEQG